MMPEISGTTLLRMLKDHSKYHQIPVIMITSDTDRELLSKCFEMGVDDLIHKPIDATALKARLNSVFRIRKYQISLEKEITERKELQAQLILTAKIAALGNIGSGIAHEIRTPLNAITGFSQILCQQLESSDLPVKFKKYIEYIYFSSQLLSELVSNILELSKTDAGKLELHYESI